MYIQREFYYLNIQIKEGYLNLCINLNKLIKIKILVEVFGPNQISINKKLNY